MQEILEAIVQGIVQRVTEFLPVSSSGHLSLVQHVMGVQNTSLLFNVMLHIGTLAAVLIAYRKLIWRLIKALGLLLRDLFTGRFRWSTMDEDRNLLVMLVIGLLPLFLLFLPVPGTGQNVKDFADLWGTDSSKALPFSPRVCFCWRPVSAAVPWCAVPAVRAAAASAWEMRSPSA